MVWFVLLVASLNLGLGYLAAAALAETPPWGRVRLRMSMPRFIRRERRRPSASQPRLADEDTERDASSRPSEAAPRTQPPTAPLSWDALPESWRPMLEAEALAPHSEVEAAAHVLRLEGNQHREQLLTAENRARHLLAAGDAEGLALVADDLRSISLAWLENQTQAAELLAHAATGESAFAPLAGQLEQVLLDQAAEIQAACIVLASLDRRTEPQFSGKLLLEQVAVLIDLAHALRDQLHSGLATLLASNERQAEQNGLAVDRLTGLQNRAAMEGILSEWRRQSSQEQSRLSAVLIDVDRFSRVNQRLGTRTGDRTLAALAMLIGQMLPTQQVNARVVRIAGQEFCVLLSGMPPVEALSFAENLRQAIEATTFDDAGAEFELTLSCGVVEVKTPESVDQLLKRAGEAVKFAKRAGRNRCALDDGSGPAMHEPPQLPVKGRAVHLSGH